MFQTIKELEDEMLNGQKLQGPYTAEEVNYMLKNKDMEDRYAQYKIHCTIFCMIKKYKHFLPWKLKKVKKYELDMTPTYVTVCLSHFIVHGQLCIETSPFDIFGFHIHPLKQDITMSNLTNNFILFQLYTGLLGMYE